MEATLFVTCLGDTFYPGAVRATVRVLERMGMRVACPPEQTCCGQPMFNAGYFDQALSVARRFVEIFDRTEGPIVTPSSSCAAMVRHHYPRVFKDDPAILDRVRKVGERTFELCEFLVKECKVNLKALHARFSESVTYHYSCHFRPLGISDEPVELIRQIEGIRYLPLKGMDQCCGFGGTFSLNFPHLSGAMAAEKVERIRETKADWLIFSDAGCAMNITGYANRKGYSLKAMHMAELVDRALGGDK
jgi:L-lactate dehydrogenase complex protein LldE